MNFIEYLLERLTENSTWRGIILLLTAIGINFTADQTAVIASAGLSLVGAINVIRKEKK
jgi:hypothetical protein